MRDQPAISRPAGTRNRPQITGLADQAALVYWAVRVVSVY